MALALQGHGLVGHDGHVQLFPEDAWGRYGGGREGRLRRVGGTGVNTSGWGVCVRRGSPP